MHNLFAYGTLQLPEVMLSVTGRTYTAQPARLDNYSRHCLQGRSFPGIRTNPGYSVNGIVFLGIDTPALQKLDEFEDSFYHRESLTVTAANGTQWPAQVYVVQEESYGLLLPDEWHLEDFQRKHLARFLLSHE